jgi:hypothetical protein
MVQKFGIPESTAMLISGHLTRDLLNRYNITSVAEIQEAGKKMDGRRHKQ